MDLTAICPPIFFYLAEHNRKTQTEWKQQHLWFPSCLISIEKIHESTLSCLKITHILSLFSVWNSQYLPAIITHSM